MNSEEFVRRIHVAVYESSIKGCLSLLEKPPGRRPHAGLVELSRWFNQLPPDDRDYVREIIQLSVRSGVFGMLTVLDGVTSIWESEEEMGTLELRYNTAQESSVLTPPTGEFLHDIFAGLVPPE